MRKTLFSILCCLVVLSCALGVVCCSDKTDPKTITVSIEISHLPNSNTFQAKYSLSQPVFGLKFNRTTEGWKEKELHPTNPNLEIRTVNDDELILSKDQTAFSEFTLEFKTTSNMTSDERDYKILDQYTDGSFLLYTGHFNVSHSVDQDCILNNSISVKNIFTFVPNASEVVYFAGIRYKEKPAVWDKETNRDTFVFFGQPTVLEADSFVILYDKGLPDWLKNQAKEIMPKILKYYEESFHISFDVKPTIFFFFKPGDAPYFFFSGDALTNQIRLCAKGNDWTNFSQEGQSRLLYFIAHEAAHLWNSHYFHYEEDKDWMYEGGARILAQELLRNLRLISDAQFSDIMSGNLHQCLLDLIPGRINESRNPYTCGSIMGLITGAAVKKADPKSNGIFDFWKNLFSLAAKNNNTYTQEMYFSLLLEKTGDKELVDGLRKLALEPIANPGEHITALLTQAGVQTTPKKDGYSPNLLSALARKAIRQIMLCDCKKNDLSTENNFIDVVGYPECKTFKEDVKIDKLGGYSILNDTLKAYDYAFTQSVQNKPIKLGVYQSDKTIEVLCPEITEKPTLYQIQTTGL